MAIKLKAAGAATPTNAPLAVVMRKLASLEAYENNPRKNDTEVPKMVELIKRFGFKVPILIRGDRIVDGHLRSKAASALQLEEVPTIDIGEMSEAEERTLRIAINKSVEWSKWDEDALGVELKAIASAGLALNLTGFSDKETGNIIAKIGKSALNEPPMKDPTGPKKTQQADAGLPADPNYVSITFHMSADNRKAVMQKLAEIQAKEGLANLSAAFVHAINNG